MDTMLNYIYWRKDITFKEREFNEIDALVLAELSYVEWDDIVKEQPIYLNEACKQYYQLHDAEDMKKQYAYSTRIPSFIKAMQDTRRYHHIKMKNYETVFDVDKEIQYAAITYVLPDGTYFIAYRGTDSSMLGWKEDMKMTYQDEIPSHFLAAEYLRRAFDELVPVSSFFGFRKQIIYPKVYLAGHSKGGNLAMYAGIAVSEMQKHIVKIFNFDGPGFRDSFYERYEMDPILSKIVTYLPVSSIIGRLLTHKEKNVIIDAHESGLSQHDAFCWKLTSDAFVTAAALSKESDETQTYIQEKLMAKPDEQKKAFLDLVFSIFDKLQISSISDFSELGIKQGLNGIKELSLLSSEDRKFFIEIMGFLWSQTKSILFVKK